MALIETAESPEDVVRLLHDAKRRLQVFEDGVDNSRLLERLRTISSAHPLLMLRTGTLVLAVLLVVAALGVPILALLNTGLARSIAPFDQAVPLPAFFPENLGLPVLLLTAALLMLFAWFMATQAALAMGRDATMLPWEAREHQKLMNDVTRLTTQKAVMERTRNTPADARPRVATPVPVSMRERSRIGSGGLGGSQPMMGGMQPFGSALSVPPSDLMGPARPPVADLGGYAAAPPGGGLRGGAPDFPNSNPPRGARAAGGGIGGMALPPSSLARPNPVSQPATRPPPGGGQPNPAAKPPLLGKGLGGPTQRASYPPSLAPSLSPAPAPTAPFTPPPAGTSGPPAAATGLLGRARSVGGTPRPAPNRPSFPPMSPSTPPGPSPFAGLGRPGAPSGDPLKPRIGDAQGQVPRPAPRLPVAVDDLSEALGAHADRDTTVDDERPVSTRARSLPIRPVASEGWLIDVVERSRALASLLPPQIRLEYNQEEGVPFTLVMSRATPAMAVRAMMQFADFLAGIPTPPGTCVELSGVGNLDRTFASAVSTALDRHFPSGYLVESEPGRISVLFDTPDPAWEGVAEVPPPTED